MHEYNHFWWRFFPKKELSQIYISMAIRGFAVSLLSIFVPLYLYQERGYSLEHTLLFFIFYSLVFAISTPLAAKFSSRYGIKHSVLLSVPFYLAFVLLLYLLPKVKTPLVVIGGLLGLALSFYWMGMHLVFYKASDHKHRGEEFGKRAFFSILSTFFGPLAGGILIKYFGFSVVFISASFLLLLSALVLFLSKEEHTRYHFSLKTLFNKNYWKDSLYYVSEGTRVMALGVIWPLFIFVILDDYVSLGLVGGLLAGLSAILFWMVGKLSDRLGKRKIVRWAVGFESLAWFFRALVSTVAQIFGVTIFGAITRGTLNAPLGAMQYDKARKNTTAYFVNREIFICLGRILVLVFVLMLESLRGGLFLTSIVNLAALLF